MARERWCRDHCDEVIENCGGLTARQKKRMLRARDVNNRYALLDPLSDTAILQFARIERKKKIRELVLNEIKQRDPQELTEARIKEIIDQVYSQTGQKGKPEQAAESVKPAESETSEAGARSRTYLSSHDEGQIGTPAAGLEQEKNGPTRGDKESDEDFVKRNPCPGPEYELHHSRIGNPIWRRKPTPAPKKELGLICPHCHNWIPRQEWIERDIESPAGD